MPRVPLVESLERTTVRQHQILARDQLLASGVDDMLISRRIKQGEWQRLLPGIYAVTNERISTEQRRIAAALYAGDESQLTGLNALHWYGFRHAPSSERVNLLIPHESRRRSHSFVVMQRTREFDDKPRDAGLYRVASPARAVIDASRSTGDLATVRAVMSEAVAANHTDVTGLDQELRRANRSRTALARRVLAELIAGIRSEPEADLRSLVSGSSILTTVLWNPKLTTPSGDALPTPDGYLPDVGLALEVDSREHHAHAPGWNRTLQRHNILTEAGVVVLHFTPREIRSEASRVLRVIEQTYLRLLQSPPDLDVLVGDPSYA